MAGAEACQIYAMEEDSTIIHLRQPGLVSDPLTEIAREGAQRMLAAALKAEADSFVEMFSHERLPDGRQRVVRHGVGPERVIQTGIGPITVQRQKVRDRAADVPASAKIRFSSDILPRWARRSRSLDALLPVLYLRGVSMGDLQEALRLFLAQTPRISVAQRRRDALAANGQTLFRGKSVDLALDVEDRVDALDRLQSERRDGSRSKRPPRFGPVTSSYV